MTMPMVEGGRPILSVRLFGFPVTVDISFVVITAIIGWVPGRTTVTSFVVWLVMVPLAVLVHELGHAFVARTTGAAPVITLAGLGGLTSYVPPAPVSRARSIAISVAGPAVGIVVGLGLLAYARVVGVGDGLARDVVATAIWTTLGWSVLNLLPILPLDGGQTLRELLPGSPPKRAVRAAMVSIVVAVLAAAVALKAGLVFGALLAAFFVFSNYTTIRSARDQEKVDVNQRLVQLLWAGRSDDAHDLLADQPADAAVHPLVRAAVRAAGDDSFGARRELESAVGRNPADPTAASLLALSHRTREDWAGRARPRRRRCRRRPRNGARGADGGVPVRLDARQRRDRPGLARPPARRRGPGRPAGPDRLQHRLRVGRRRRARPRPRRVPAGRRARLRRPHHGRQRRRHRAAAPVARVRRGPPADPPAGPRRSRAGGVPGASAGR